MIRSTYQHLGVLGLLALGGCAAGGELLGTLSDDARVLVPVAFSLDGRRAAWVERVDGASRVVHGAKRGKAYGILC